MDEMFKRYYRIICGYSDTPQKHDFTKRLRINGIRYEFVYDDPYPDYGNKVVIGIPKPEYKWQMVELRKIVEDVLRQEPFDFDYKEVN